MKILTDKGIIDRNKGGLFDPFFVDFFAPMFERNGSSFEKILKTDVSEEENSYLIEMDVPGYKKEEVSLELDNGYLTVMAEKSSENEEKEDKKYIRRERSYCSQKRTFYVGDNITEGDIEASFENGTLKITVPKKKEEIPEKKRILIK